VARTICIFHGNCADGFVAAWVVWKWANDNNREVEFIAAQYQQPPPDVAGARVIIVDFSYKENELVAMVEQAAHVLLIDHHKTARAEIERAMARMTPVQADRFMVVFSLDRSGAGLTWDHFFAGEPRLKLVDHVEDRDLWRFGLEGSREIHSVLRSHADDFEVVEKLSREIESNAGRMLVIRQGEAIDRAHLKHVKDAIASFSYRAVIAGHEVPVLNANYHMASDAGNLMAEGEPFAACYIDGPKGRGYSLRSKDTGLDVSEIAKLFGGGGHARAAGFTVPHGTGVALRPGLASAMLGPDAGRF